MSQTPPRLSTLQQDRSRETRRKLVTAAERLWRVKGFDETTVSDVCDEAGVSKGTFYFYFPRKEHLLIELGLSTTDRVLQETILDPVTDLPVEQALRHATEQIVRRVSRTPKALLGRTIGEMYRHADEWEEIRGQRADFGRVFESIFARAQERGEISSDLPAQEVATILGGTILSGMLSWARGNLGDVTLGDVLWRRVQVVLNGARAGLTEPALVETVASSN